MDGNYTSGTDGVGYGGVEGGHGEGDSGDGGDEDYDQGGGSTYTPGASAFGDYIGGGSTFWGSRGTFNGDDDDTGGGAITGSGGAAPLAPGQWIPDGDGESGSDSDSWAGGGGISGVSGAGGEPTGKENYDGGNRLFNSNNPDDMQDQQALGLGATGYHGDLSAPLGEPTGISLSSSTNPDVFDQDSGVNATFNQAIARSRGFTQQSQVDNSGLTEGLLNGLANYKGLPARADGGPVSAGQMYKVGERGHQEAFVPSQDGTIIPLDKGALTPNITINNSHPDVDPGHIQVQQNGSDISMNIRKDIVNDLANNGMLADAMARRFRVMAVPSRRS
jgi:hypothetical protein